MSDQRKLLSGSEKEALCQVNPALLIQQLGGSIRENGKSHVVCEYQGEKIKFSYTKIRSTHEEKWLAYDGPDTIGDHFSFLKKRCGMEFKAATQFLADISGINIDQQSAKINERKSKQIFTSTGASGYRPPPHFPMGLIDQAFCERFGVSEALISPLIAKKFLRGAQVEQYIDTGNGVQCSDCTPDQIKINRYGREFRHRQGVLFVGHDDHGAELFGHFISLDGLNPFKKDLSGSRKIYASMINNASVDDKKPLYITEGPGDLLAVMQMHLDSEGELPNGLMVAGCGLTQAFETKRMEHLVASSSEVILVRQHDFGSKKIAIDQHWQAYVQDFEKKFGLGVQSVYPDERFKDLSGQIRGIESQEIKKKKGQER